MLMRVTAVSGSAAQIVVTTTHRETSQAAPDRPKFVVFSNFPALLRAAHAHLLAAGIASCGVLEPGASHITETFTNDPSTAVLLICMRVGQGAAGLNLTAAHHVVLLEPQLNPGIETQAIGRVHRLGQTHPVTVHRIQARQTIENQVLVLQERRKRMYQGRGSCTVLDRAVTETMTTEMLEMFGLDALAGQVALIVEKQKQRRRC